ncbi:DNA recombination protein RmuC [Paracoccus sp. DMF-8]|uniref:DNA recombination protein RmuC n=1 Tax=Paracoccus sp. DMF-8 TaxID=3019445 RepID=UPI0023E83201|nr:DNA recombination protein RmuC [Paracoccus sp. DMF-8]MDF3605421.1 DNA recombination protein RmuC [Paracoccus sp. DMF-8]
MDPTLSTQISAWLEDASHLQGLLLAVLLVLAVLFWRERRAAGLLRDQAARADALTADLQARAGQIAGLQADLAQSAECARAHELRIARMESAGAVQADRLRELMDERDGLADALHGQRQAETALQRELAETRLAADKDRETAERDIATLRELREEMSRNFRLMADETLRRQGEDMQKRHGEQLSALLTPFRDQVHRFQTELQTRNKQTDEERARLREQIETLHKRSEDISREAVALTRALKGDRQKQGAWGEMILARLLEESGLEQGIHYTAQDSVTDEQGKRWRPDVTVRLPQKKVLVIDSKVSLTAYEEAVNADDAPIADAALKRHVAALRAHVTGLSGKGYQALDEGSVDYVLMFIPIEGAFSEALRVDPDLARFAMEKRVGLATPTTLMLTLRTVDHIWTVERRRSNAMQIAARAGQLYDKLHGFVSAIEDVGVQLDRAQKSHATAIDRLTRGSGNVIRQAEMLRELGARAQKRLAIDHDGETLAGPGASAGDDMDRLD